MPGGAEPVRVNKIILDSLHLQCGDKVLDLGCAAGAHGRALALRGYQVFGIDPEFQLVREFGNLARRDGLVPAQASSLVGDAHDLPFESQSFAAVISTEVLEHTREPEQVLREAARVLRPRGTLCVAVPTEATERLFGWLHPKWFDHSGHLQVFSTGDLLDLLGAAGFEVTATRGENSEWSLFWLVFATLRTPFTFTGTPTSYRLLIRIYWKAWHTLGSIGILPLLQRVGDRLFPKSLYVYARKR